MCDCPRRCFVAKAKMIKAWLLIDTPVAEINEEDVPSHFTYGGKPHLHPGAVADQPAGTVVPEWFSSEEEAADEFEGRIEHGIGHAIYLYKITFEKPDDTEALLLLLNRVVEGTAELVRYVDNKSASLDYLDYTELELNRAR